MTDQGIDPRQVKSAEAAAKETAIAVKKIQESRETVTVGKAWGELHLHDHMPMQSGREKRTRSNKLTEPGTLAAIRLINLTTERMIVWAKRPTRARNARAL